MRIVPSSDPNEYYIVIARDREIPKERLKDLNQTWSGEEIILTFSKLIKGKKNNIKRLRLNEEAKVKDEQVESEEIIEEDKDVGKDFDSPFGESQL